MKKGKKQGTIPQYWITFLIFLVITLTLQSNRLSQKHSSDKFFSEAQQIETLAQTRTQLNLWNKFPNLGFKNLIADWAYLQFLQYFGDDDLRDKTGYDLSPDYFEVVINRDPYYPYFYLFLSGSSSVFAGQPDRTVALMNQGLSYMSPEAPEGGYMVWRYKGTDELLFLGDAESAQQSFQTAADWANQSDGPDAEVVAAVSQRTADFLANNPVSKRAQVDAWASILSNSFDEQTQRLAIERIEALGGQVIITEDDQIQIGYPQED
jgi:hypothetical protein